MNQGKQHEFFEKLYNTYNKVEYIHTDPIRFAHELDGNKEFIAFTAAVFAYGNMKSLQANLFNYFNIAGTDPLNLNCEPDKSLYYRFQSVNDISNYSKAMKIIYEKYGTLLNLYNDGGFRKIHDFFPEKSAGLNFLIPKGEKSAKKRINMFLRWMIRCDDIDLGLWKNQFDKKNLSMPTDTHILRLATNLEIIGAKEKSSEAVKKTTEFFKKLNPLDPTKYDFTLTRLGIVNGCEYKQNQDCIACLHFKDCLFN